MRFIIRELPYEMPLAAGQLRYELDGQATGALESWRLTSAASGYRFLRVDFDARKTENELTVLYHLVLDEHGRAERLSFRVWRQNLKINGNVLSEEDELIAARDVNGSHYEDAVPFEASCGFWFPSAIGTGLLANCAQVSAVPSDGSSGTVTLDGLIHGRGHEDPGTFALKRAEVRLRTAPAEQLELMGRLFQVKPFFINWDGRQKTLWLDEHGWPLKTTSDDGLTAVESRYIRYQ